MTTTKTDQAPKPRTIGELKDSGYSTRSVRDELRDNLLARLKASEPVFDGIIGFDNTVVPQVINAVLSRHNLILLGLRGQAKTRILRQLQNLLNPWMPIIQGSEVNDDPLAPISAFGRRAVTECADDTAIAWVPRSERYREKLATPDVSIADLIGDLDPVKAATQRLSFSHEEVINYGIIPRTNRGIFAINELPDLQPRIQVGLFNILEERDVQIRGFPVRLPMDLLLVFTANPEDYTNRGSIITPLKDRIESQILTHYPESIDDAMSITNQEAWQERVGSAVHVPPMVRRVIDRVAFEARDSEYVDQGSGVSARLPIAALENVISNVERRRAITGEKDDVARVIDLSAALPAMTGKIELVYEGEQEGPQKIATNLLGQAIRAEFESVFPPAYKQQAKRRPRGGQGQGQGLPSKTDAAGEVDLYKPIIDYFSKGERLELTDTMPFSEYSKALSSIEGLAGIAGEHAKPASKKEAAVAMEFVLEGLHQSALLAKEDVDRRILYCDMLGSMFEDLD